MTGGQADARQLFKAIRRIIRAIDLRSRAVAKAVGLTIPQIVVLTAVRDMGEVTTKQISDAADLSAATVIVILDRLEEKGLIQRYRSQVDRRIVHSRLTASGRATLRKAPPLLHQRFGAEFARLDPDDRAALIGAMDRVGRMMGASGVDAAPILTTTSETT